MFINFKIRTGNLRQNFVQIRTAVLWKVVLQKRIGVPDNAMLKGLVGDGGYTRLNCYLIEAKEVSA